MPAIMLVLGVALGSCSSTNDTDVTAEGARADGADRRYLVGNIAAQREAVNARQVARTLAEYLPNQLFAVGESPPRPESAGVVRGVVVRAVGARGYYVPGSGPEADAPGGTETTFDDPRAQWRVIDVTVRVDDALGLGSMKEVHIGISVDGPDTAALLSGARSLGSVVAVLDRKGFFAFDKDLYTLDDVNSLLATTGPDGTIDFETMGAESAAFVGSLTTWDAVEAEAARSKDPIVTDDLGTRKG